MEPMYDYALFFDKDGLAPVQSGGKWGFVDQTGTLVVEARYDRVF